MLSQLQSSLGKLAQQDYPPVEKVQQNVYYQLSTELDIKADCVIPKHE